MEIVIKKILVHESKLEIDAVLKTKSNEVRKYFMRFKAGGVNDDRWLILRSIASVMSENTGDDRRCQGSLLKKILCIDDEKEFQLRIYHNYWYSTVDESRIGKKTVFQVFGEDDIQEIVDIDFRKAFAKALFSKEGGKKSDMSYYWLGDYQKTEIVVVNKSNTDSIELDSSERYLQKGEALLEKAKIDNSEILILRAFECFEDATRLRPDNAQTYCDWGAGLYHLAILRKDFRILHEALDKLKTALELKDNYPGAYYNTGLVLSRLAEFENSEARYEEAKKNIEAAIALRKDYPEAHYNHGLLLQLRAQKHNDKDLYLEAIDKYETATQYKRDYPRAYCNWGIILTILGEMDRDESLLLLAEKKYKLAIKYQKEYADAHYNWALSLESLNKMIGRRNKNRVIKLFFTSFLLFILQDSFINANYVAMKGLLRNARLLTNQYYYDVGTVFNNSILYLRSLAQSKAELINEIQKYKGKYKEVDIIIDALINGRLNKNDDSEDSGLSNKTAYYLAERLL